MDNFRGIFSIATEFNVIKAEEFDFYFAGKSTVEIFAGKSYSEYFKFISITFALLSKENYFG